MQLLDEALLARTAKALLAAVEDKPDEPDEYTKLELLNLDDQVRKLEIIARKQNIKERKKYAKWIFVMLSIWLFLNLILICLSGIGRVPFTDYNFHLSDAVIITLITTTTANIAAFFLVVTKHLFPTK